MSEPVLERLRAIRDRGLLPAWIIIIALWRAAAGDHTEAMWMSREGEAVLQGSPLVHADRWGWSSQPWDFIPTSPGWELVAAVSHRAFSIAGFGVLAFMVTAFTLSMSAWAARTLGASRITTIAAMLFSSALANGILTSRAGSLAFALLLAEFLVVWSLRLRLQSARGVSAAMGLAAIAFTASYLGIWLHGSWTLYAVIAAGGTGIILRDKAFGDRRRRLALTISCAAASLGATLLGPLGVSAWTNTLRVGAECRGLVKEWTSPWTLGSIWPGMWITMFALLALGIASELPRRRRVAMQPLLAVFILLALGAVVAGAMAIRFLLLGVIASTPLLAFWLTQLVRSNRFDGARALLGERAREPYWRTIAALLAVAVLPLAALDAVATPWIVNPAITALPRACRLFSDDFDAKAVEYWRPDVRVWVDGRQDYWGRQRILETNRYKAQNLIRGLVPAGTTCVLLPTAEQLPLASALNASAAWQQVSRNADLTLWVSQTA